MAGGDAGIVEDREQAVEVGAVAVEQQRGGIANLRLSIAVGRQSRGEGEEAGFRHELKLYTRFPGTSPAGNQVSVCVSWVHGRLCPATPIAPGHHDLS